MMKKETNEMIKAFFARNAEFIVLKDKLIEVLSVCVECALSGKTFFFAGNGGSAADCCHIAGELSKSFLKKRPLDPSFVSEYERLYGNGTALPLEGGIKAIALPSALSVMTAIANDMGAELVFAQQLYVLAEKGDIFFGLTTSGNSESVINAVKTAKAKGVFTVAMTGQDGGKIKEFADITITAPATETYLVQELHAKLYHFLCAALETEIFG